MLGCDNGSIQVGHEQAAGLTWVGVVWRGHGADVIVAQEGAETLRADDELLPILLQLLSKQSDSCPVRVVVVIVEVLRIYEVTNLTAVSMLLPAGKD